MEHRFLARYEYYLSPRQLVEGRGTLQSLYI
jgi:hypothetical protein